MKKNFIVTKNRKYFEGIGDYNYCSLTDMVLPNIIAVDSETDGLNSRHFDMFCLQIGTGENNYIIDFYTSEDHYTFEEVIPYLDGKTLVGQNLTFDLQFFYKHDFWPKNVRDTMIASKILYNGNPTARHDLGTLMNREIGVVLDKYEQKNIHIVKLSQKSTIEYSFLDVDQLLELHSALEKKIDSGGFRPTYDLHCRYIRALSYMEMCGLPISSEKWKAKMNQDILNSFDRKRAIEDYIFDNLPQYANRQYDMFEMVKNVTVSVNSPKQMLKVFNAFGIPTKDKYGKDSINEEVISKSKHEFVKMWLDYQNANHRVTTFGDSIYQRIENERIYTNFNPCVDTARLSTRRGEINFLNFPADKATRYCFRCQSDHVMVVCDYSGQETVIAADLSGDAAMTKSVNEGADLHCLLARVLFPELEDLTDEQIIADHKEKRQASKAPRFAFQYGGNAFTIHQKEGIPYARAQEIEDGFKNLHSGLYEWGDKVLAKAIKVGYIESVDGWKLPLPFFDDFQELKTKVDNITREEWQRYKIGKIDYKKQQSEKEKGVKYELQFPESVALYKEKKEFVSKYFKLRSEYLRLCLNNPVQTRGSHQIKLAGCLIFDWIVNAKMQWKVLMCNSVHDEIVVETLEELKNEVRDIVQCSMIEAGNYYLTDLLIKADAHTGPSWGEAKP